MAEIDEGSVIGNYRVIRLLGQGGMGTVYEVEHLELGTRYALKTFTFRGPGWVPAREHIAHLARPECSAANAGAKMRRILWPVRI